MAPPQLASLENYSDVQFRDVVHRRSTLVAPSANVIQKTYHHMDGSTPRLSGAELLTTDAGGNVQYSLMLGSNTRPLDANVMTLANAASWTANSVFTANATHMTVRAPTLIADSIDCQSLTLANDVSFANVSASSLTVVGNIQIDTSTLTVDSQNNRVGIGTTNPSQALEIAGNINISSGNGLRLGGTQVLSAGTLGSSITQSNLTKLGLVESLQSNIMTANAATLGALTVSGAANFDGIFTQTFEKQLGSATGSALEICQIDVYYGTFAAELVLVCRDDPRLSQVYQFCVVDNATGGAYHRLLPITGDGAGVAVEIRSTSGISSKTTLRLVRITSDTGIIDCHLKVHYDTRDTTASIDDLSGTDSGVTVSSTIFQSTLLTQINGNVGIGTHDPSHLLTVAGAANVESLIVSQGATTTTLAVSANATIGNISTNTIVGTYASLSGNMVVGNLTSNTITSATGSLLLENLTDVDSLVYNWTSRTNPVNSTWSAVAYASATGKYAAVTSAYPETHIAMSSSDGIIWTNHNIYSSILINASWTSVTSNDTRFVAVSHTDDKLQGESKQVKYSDDGTTWALVTTPTSTTSREWQSVCYGGGLYVAVASAGTTGELVMTSPTGVEWTTRTSAADNAWQGVCWGNGLYVAVASSGTGNRVMTSPDGTTWTIRTSAADYDWQSVCYGDPGGSGIYVAVASSGTGNRVMTSPDGLTWTARTSAADYDWSHVAYGNGMFVAVAKSGTGDRVMTSRDGITWKLRSSAANNSWEGVVYGEAQFVAVASTGTGDQIMSMAPGSVPSANAASSGLMYYDSSTGLVTYGSYNVNGLNATFSRLQVAESISVPELEISGDLRVPGIAYANAITTTGTATAAALSTTNLTATGNLAFSNMFQRTFAVSVESADRSTGNICRISADSFAAELIVIQDTVGSGIARKYEFYEDGRNFGSTFFRILPCAGEDSDDIAVETNVDAFGRCSLRLKRLSAAAQLKTYSCIVKVFANEASTPISTLPGAATVSGGTAVATSIHYSSPLTKYSGRVGIGTASPTEVLTVRGNTRMIDATSPSTVFTQATPSTFNFSDKWRLFYNETDDALEIQKNISGTWTTTAVLAT